MTVHRGADLIFRRILRRRKQIGSLDHHSVLAVAAMRDLDVDPRLLNRMQHRRRRRRTALLRPQSRQALERRHRTATDSSQRRHARPNLLAVQKHRTSTTLRKAATKPRAVQMKLVVQDVQERRIKARRDRVNQSVHLDLQLTRHSPSVSECEVVCLDTGQTRTREETRPDRPETRYKRSRAPAIVRGKLIPRFLYATRASDL